MKIEKSKLEKDWATGVWYKIAKVSDGNGNETEIFLCFDSSFLADKFYIRNKESESERNKIEKWIDREVDKFLRSLSEQSDLFRKPCYLKYCPKTSRHIAKFIERAKREGLIDEECKIEACDISDF